MLSTTYPLVRVPYFAKREADVDARNTKTSSNKLFRMLIGSIFPDDIIWANSNADTFFKERPDEVHAVLGKIY